jgi:hypothetical protein
MKPSDVITSDLRNTLDDAGGTQWTDAVLMGYLRDAIELFRTEHPETRLDSDGELVDVAQADFAAMSDEFTMDAIYRIPLMHYVAFRAFASDAADSSDTEQAKLHRDQYIAFFLAVR